MILACRDWPSTEEQIGWYKADGGTGPIVLEAGPMLADQQHLEPPTAWTPPYVLDDLAHAAAVGVDEVIWDLNIVGTPPEQQVEALERLAESLRKVPA